MSPLDTSSDRTATISLTKNEEKIVRNGFDKNTPYEEAVVKIILEKLHKSLKVSDTLLGPVGHTRLSEAHAQINLDLLGE